MSDGPNRLKEVQAKSLSKEELDAIVGHWFNHRETFLKRDIDKISLLIQHIAHLEGVNNGKFREDSPILLYPPKL